MPQPVLRPAKILLPAEGTDLGKWAVLACDQFTSEPEYWQKVDKEVGGAPSTLRITLPEVYLEQPDVQTRIDAIHARMEEYLQGVFAPAVEGYIYVERTLENGAVRQGLVGAVDLEDYSYKKGTNPRIRPSENTVEERIPPRLAVRRGAALETPHILMLADDAAQRIIEPLAGKKLQMAMVYNQPLMLGGGEVRGWAVTDPDDIRELAAEMAKLDDVEAFRQKYGATRDDAAFALAVGDGNHSLATAKALWEEVKPTLAPEERETHPARFCLVELENVQSPAIEIEPIHRVVFGADAAAFTAAFKAFAGQKGAQLLPQGPYGQQFVVVGAGDDDAFGLQDAPWPLAVGTLEAFLEEYLAANPSCKVDYVHGEESVRSLAQKDAVGILLPPFEKSDLFRGVALGGVLPRKTFSMGTAVEKRYYLECRKIQK